MKDIINPYGELAFAVCLQAVDDYRRGRRFVDKKPVGVSAGYSSELRRWLTDSEKFMKSGTFDVYSGLDGREVLKRLRKECDRGDYGNIARCRLYE